MAIVVKRPVPRFVSESAALSDRNFARIASIVSQHTGIKLPATKRVMLEGRLRRRAALAGFATVDEYCAYLFENGGMEREFQHVVDVVTTNKTDFFREAGHFRLLEERIVPELMAGPAAKRTIKLWSAASSNGAEAYTMAMVMAELAQRNAELRYAILGTDISTAMLESARRAIYPRAMIAPVSPELRRRYVMFDDGAGEAGRARIVPELRKCCNFLQMNLMDESYPVDRDVDIIFVRNVLIYFEADVQEAVVTRLWSHLRPGGHLMLGHSESMIGTRMGLRQVASAVFRKDMK